MSENLLATLITLILLLAIVLWVPLLELLYPACIRLFRRHDDQSSASRHRR